MRRPFAFDYSQPPDDTVSVPRRATVNALSRQNTRSSTNHYPDDARWAWVTALFGEKYGDWVRVVSWAERAGIVKRQWTINHSILTLRFPWRQTRHRALSRSAQLQQAGHSRIDAWPGPKREMAAAAGNRLSRVAMSSESTGMCRTVVAAASWRTLRSQWCRSCADLPCPRRNGAAAPRDVGGIKVSPTFSMACAKDLPCAHRRTQVKHRVASPTDRLLPRKPPVLGLLPIWPHVSARIV